MANQSRFSLSENESSAEIAFLYSAFMLLINILVILSSLFLRYGGPKPIDPLRWYDMLLVVVLLALGLIAILKASNFIDQLFFAIVMVSVSLNAVVAGAFSANAHIQATTPYVRALIWLTATLLTWFIFRSAKTGRKNVKQLVLPGRDLIVRADGSERA